MPRGRSPNLVKLFVGQHIVNGVSVGIGVISVALAASAIFGFDAGQPATLGAISASISDFPAPWREKARTLGFGFSLALLSTAAIQAALPWPALALLTVGALSFAGGMVTGLGRWAVAVGMQVLVPMVFVLGFPRETFATALRIEAILALGGLAYIAFALLATIVTDASGRRLVAGESIREFSIYLRSVARVFDPNADLAAAYGSAIRQQAALAEQLQSARFLLLNRARLGSERIRLAATIGVLLDAFDALVASQSGVALIRGSGIAAPVLARIDAALRLAARDLDRLSLELLRSERPALPPEHRRATDALKHDAESIVHEPGADPTTLEAIDAVVRRLVLSLGHIRRLERTLSDDKEAAASMDGVDLATFIPKRSYSLRTLRSHLTIASPVFRFSARLALAMMAGAIVAQFFGDAAHGNWVLLAIAVIMRANYGLTKQRRDDRVIGTLVGCVLAAAAVAYLPPVALLATQGISVAVLHSFVRLNYRVSSAGASVSALVALHLARPDLSAPVVARLVDTLVGAAIAHLFSYVWPHWEFAEAPRIAKRLLARLAAFAEVALKPGVSDHDYRFARKDMIEAIAALSDSAGRMSIEPTATRRGLDEMAALLLAAHALVTQISAARLDARMGVAAAPPAAIRNWLRAQLALEGSAAPEGVAPSGALASAALAVVDAAKRFEKAARDEVDRSNAA